MTQLLLSQYQTIVFDCDGVILDSNRVKTEAFYAVAIQYGHEIAQSLVSYHVGNGGISRYRKFEYLLTHLLGEKFRQDEIDRLTAEFSEEVKRGLLDCPVAEGLDKLRAAMPQCRWLVVSGGDQGELREVFKERGLIQMFDGGIFGSPDSKDFILDREISLDNLRHPAVFLGDSRYDYEASQRANMDFLFVSNWTEVDNWESYCRDNNIQAIGSIGDLLDFNLNYKIILAKE